MLRPIKLLFINVSEKNSRDILNKIIDKNFYITIVNRANNFEEAESFQYEYAYNLVFIDTIKDDYEVFSYIKKFSDKKIIWCLLVDQPSFNFMREAIRHGVSDIIMKKMINDESFNYLDKLFYDTKLNQILDPKYKLSILLSNIKDHQNVSNKNLINILKENNLYLKQNDYYLAIVRVDSIVYWYRLLKISRKKIENQFKEFIEESIPDDVYFCFSKKHTVVLFFSNFSYRENQIYDILKSLIENAKKLFFSISIGYSKKTINIEDFLFRYKDLIDLQESKFYIGNSSIVNEDNRVKFSRLTNSNKISNNILTWINKSNYSNAIYFTNYAIKLFKENNTKIEDVKSFFFNIIDNKISDHINISSNIFYDKDIYKTLIKSSDTILNLSVNAKILIMSLIDYNDQINSYKNREYIIKVKEYVDLNIHKKISLEEIALHLNISQFYFSRIFKEKTSTSFTDYVNKAKIKHSKDMLVNTDKSLNTISQELGYSNQFYFSKTFRKFEKITPSQYRKLNKKIKEE